MNTDSVEKLNSVKVATVGCPNIFRSFICVYLCSSVVQFPRGPMLEFGIDGVGPEFHRVLDSATRVDALSRLSKVPASVHQPSITSQLRSPASM